MNERMDEFSDHLTTAMASLGDPLRMLVKEGRTRQQVYEVMSEALDGLVAHLQVDLRGVDFDDPLSVIEQRIAERYKRYAMGLAATKQPAMMGTTTALFPVLMEMFLLARLSGAEILENLQHTRQLGDEIIRRRLGMDCPYEPPMLVKQRE